MRTMMRRTAIFEIISCLLLVACSPRHVDAKDAMNPQNLAAYNWAVNASPNLATNAPSARVIESFTRFVEHSALGESFLGDKGGTEICSYRFANLRNDGFFSLVVGIGLKQRPGCGDVDIIDKAKSKTGFELFWSGGLHAGSDIPGSIEDLGSDGKLEFLLRDTLGSIRGRCSANWTTIYAWTGSNYTNVSAQFKDYYREKLDSLTKAMATLQPQPDPRGYRLRDKPCMEAEAAAIQRFLGISEAGLDQALTLAGSQDRFEREFATEILSVVEGAQAREGLERLSKDADPTVKLYAKYGLSKGPIKISAESFQGPY
jgi:hypothetical protein